MKKNEPGEEVAEVDEFAVILVLDVDYSPTVLAPTNGFAIDDNIALGPHDREWDDILSENAR